MAGVISAKAIMPIVNRIPAPHLRLRRGMSSMGRKRAKGAV